MGDGIYSALSGAVAQSVALDATANNVANANTAGFRAGRPVFHEMLARAGAGAPHFSAVVSMAQDTTAGTVRDTGRPLDIALANQDFLAIGTPRGERYTRAGNLRVDASGALLATSGDPVLGEDNRPIKVDPTKPTSISPSGEIKQGEDTVGRLRVVTFDKPENLRAETATLLASTPEAGAPTVSSRPVTVGAIEESNASPMRSMTDLITATRTFDAFQRTIDAFREADRKVTTTVPSR